jgi:hypothetical protein
MHWMWGQLFFSHSTEAAVRGFRIYLRSTMHWMWGQLFFRPSTEAAVRGFLYLRSPMHWMWGQLFFSLSTEAAVRGLGMGLPEVFIALDVGQLFSSLFLEAAVRGFLYLNLRSPMHWMWDSCPLASLQRQLLEDSGFT